ncbi:MAG: nucleoside monophosphate kinase [candidate division SR1 bacterium]|nr:nucleoside monophosphate kinase [candidate division SR1 bacterium]
MKFITLFGPPGGGKGTTAKMLAQKLAYVHLSTGDVFRERAKISDPLGLQIKGLIDDGRYVPDDITVRVVEEFVTESRSHYEGIIFDGFPRTLEQVRPFERLQHQGDTNVIILLHVEEKALISRLLKRAGEDQRTDDSSLETIQKRIETFKTLTLPVIEHYADRYLLSTIVGTGKTPEQVSDETYTLISAMM